MKKIPSLFKRNYDGDRLVRDEIVEGCEWVLLGEGVPTEKWDGTCCLVRDHRLYKRYDRKLRKKGLSGPWTEKDFKPAPDGWEAAEHDPDLNTAHWPGWLPVGDGPEDAWHREAWITCGGTCIPGGTYELIGPKVQGNPHGFEDHALALHGSHVLTNLPKPRTFDGIREFLQGHPQMEGIVFHHVDGRMCKVKQKDLGFPWPPKTAEVS